MSSGDSQSSSANRKRRSLAVGKWGEEIVARWLESQGWEILHRRWCCRWGELDLIVRSRSTPILAFVEVKTRGSGNWDADGLLSITPQKQAKLWLAAELFLSTYPELANLSCRFDIALVSHSPLSPSPLSSTTIAQRLHGSIAQRLHGSIAKPPLQPVALGQPIVLADRSWTLQVYLESAFDHESDT